MCVSPKSVALRRSLFAAAQSNGRMAARLFSTDGCDENEPLAPFRQLKNWEHLKILKVLFVTWLN